MSARAEVQLFEHETIRVGQTFRSRRRTQTATFTQAHHDALARYNDEYDGLFFRIGHKRVQATQFVGYVEVGSLAIEILPKADRSSGGDAQPWRAGLLEMLRVSTGLRLSKPSAASQVAGRSPLLELIAEKFLECVENLLHEGLARSYRTDESNGPTFRGKLLVPQQVRENLVRADRFYVRHTTFDRDIVVNRILAAALEALAGRALSAGLAARVVSCRLAFPELSAIRATATVFDRLQLGRSTARYGDALILARMILEQRAPELRSGKTPVFALLFDMNLLWERYIAVLFRRAAGLLHVSTQETTSLWRAPGLGTRTVRPDLVVRSRPDGPVLLIVDTKWRVVPDGNPSDDELKQMFVYNELFHAPRSLLLYPSAGPPSPYAGQFHRRDHVCETVHLGVIEGDGWVGASLARQVGQILASVNAVASVAVGPA